MSKFIKVIPKNKKDKKSAKLMEQVFNHMYPDYENFLNAIVMARLTLRMIYGVEVPNDFFNQIIDEAVKLKVKNE